MEEINNFIKTIMEKDLEEGKVSQIVTHFRHALKRESPKREKTTCQDLSYFLCPLTKAFFNRVREVFEHLKFPSSHLFPALL